MRFTVLLAVFLTLFAEVTESQIVEGTITNNQGKAVPYASIYVASLKKGTTANESGQYILPLTPGNYELSFQYLGYQTVNVKVSLGESNLLIDVTLQPQDYLLPEVIITSTGEDPAYYVMRKAIGMSQYYQNQLDGYEASVYLKGSGYATKIPMLMKKQLKEQGIEEGKHYVTETMSEIMHKKGEPLQTRVISTRSSLPGSDNDPMQFMTLSLYNDKEGLISPLGKDAFAVYRYKLDGTFMEDFHTIYKIKVIPKRKGNDLYSGWIFIRDGSWSIHSVQLSLNQRMFDVTINQVYQSVSQMVWMPVSHDYDVKVNFMGVNFSFKYLVSISDYKIRLNKQLDHAFYARLSEEDYPKQENLTEGTVHITESKEIRKVNETQQKIASLYEQNSLNNKEMRELNRLIKLEAREQNQKPNLEIKSRNTIMDDSASKRPSEYWQQNRPVPLTQSEKTGFLVTDSLSDMNLSDTASQKKRKVWTKLVLGGHVWEFDKGKKMSYDGLIGINTFNFNTVDGFVFKQAGRFEHRFRPGFQHQFTVNGKYAFSRDRFMGTAAYRLRFAPLHRGVMELEGGRNTFDFNQSGGLHPLLNGLNSLFFRQNIAKLYEADFIRANLQYDLSNGLETKVEVSYVTRRNLLNNSDFYLTNPFGKEYTSNIPTFNGIDSTLVEDAATVRLKADFSFTPFYYYRVIEGRKRMSHSSWPTINLGWKVDAASRDNAKSITQEFNLGIQHRYGSRLAGQIEFFIGGGVFVGDKPLHFADYKHFEASPTLVGSYAQLTTFRGLNPYERSTSDNYAQLHLRYEHARILIKRLPFLADKLIRESLFLNVLTQKVAQPYVEAGYGIQQLFLLFNAEVFAGFEGGRHQITGFRIGIPIGEATIRL